MWLKAKGIRKTGASRYMKKKNKTKQVYKFHILKCMGGKRQQETKNL